MISYAIRAAAIVAVIYAVNAYWQPAARIGATMHTIALALETGR